MYGHDVLIAGLIFVIARGFNHIQIPHDTTTFRFFNIKLIYDNVTRRFPQGSSQCSRRTGSHDKLKQVLAETTPKLVKSVHLDYDLFLQVDRFFSFKLRSTYVNRTLIYGT